MASKMTGTSGADLRIVSTAHPQRTICTTATSGGVLLRASASALAAAGASLAVYGHLHGEEDHAWAPRGTFRGTELRFVAVDFTGFRPVPVWRSGEGVLPPPPR